MRTIGVSVAAAVGAVVLIGGVVLALRPSGETTLTPAGPTETTVAPVDGIPILIPELDPAPLFDLGPDAKEIVWQEPGETLADDVRENASAEWLDEVVHVVFGGAVGEQRLYDFVGGVGADEVGGEPRWSGACLVEYGPGGTSGASCGDRDARGSVGGGFRIGTDGLMTVSVSGRAPIRSSVAVLEIDGTVYWRRTRDGYFVLSADASPDANVRYVIYDSGGGVLAGSTIGVTNELADEVADAATQTTEAVTDPGDTCSGARFFPDVDTAGVPEPVIQTLGQIMLFGS
ncbi:MAG: hypothetical protein GY925_27695, partial [Actinomycetia bacterium]|nr:hypothetical protein [Actinomycetes bacterium]